MTVITVNLIMIGLLALAVGAMFMYRHWIEDHEDHNIHLHNTASDTQIIHTQQDAAKKLAMVEKTIRYLTVVLVVYGLAIVAYASYREWISQ